MRAFKVNEFTHKKKKKNEQGNNRATWKFFTGIKSCTPRKK